MFNYYVRSKQVLEFEKLFNMFVGDKLKECLSVTALDYVLSIEEGRAFTFIVIILIHSNNSTDGKFKGNVVTVLDGKQERPQSYKRYGNDSHGIQDSQIGVT